MVRLFLIAVLLYVIILCGGYIFLYTRGFIGPGFFENVAPVITLENVPEGFGNTPAVFRIHVEDDEAGLDEVIVRAQQAKRKVDLLTKFYQKSRQKEDLLELSVTGPEQGLREGKVTLTVSAFDRSFFNNKAVRTMELPVDYRKPRLEVLTAQHNVNQGGVEFAFYKLMDGTAIRSGVKVGDKYFRGFPAGLLNPGFENMPEVFFSFFAVPSQFRSSESAISAFASNRVGNTNYASFYYRIIPHRFRSEDVMFSSASMRSKLEEVLVNTGGDPSDVPLDSRSLADAFREALENLHRVEEREFARFDAESAGRQMWKVPFQRPTGGSIKRGFGGMRRFLCDGIEAGGDVHGGLDISASLRSSVFAVNDGKVLYVGYLGSYGNTVVVDHGFGLISVYSHLSSVKAAAGDAVLQGAEIGRTGTSGLAEGDHLHFEMRLQGVPVNPVEWWDTRWINDHIIAKIHQTLGQTASQPAGESEE